MARRAVPGELDDVGRLPVTASQSHARALRRAQSPWPWRGRTPRSPAVASDTLHNLARPPLCRSSPGDNRGSPGRSLVGRRAWHRSTDHHVQATSGTPSGRDRTRRSAPSLGAMAPCAIGASLPAARRSSVAPVAVGAELLLRNDRGVAGVAIEPACFRRARTSVARVLERGRLPGDGTVALLAGVTEPVGMRIGLAMAAGAIARQRSFRSGWCGRPCSRAAMAPASAKPVSGHGRTARLPARGDVATGAVRAAAAVMHVVGCVARDALHRGPGKAIAGVARAGRLRVPVAQAKRSSRGRTGLRQVSVSWQLRQSAPSLRVRFVGAVTVDAARACLAEFPALRVACVAVGRRVCAVSGNPCGRDRSGRLSLTMSASRRGARNGRHCTVSARSRQRPWKPCRCARRRRRPRGMPCTGRLGSRSRVVALRAILLELRVPATTLPASAVARARGPCGAANDDGGHHDHRGEDKARMDIRGGAQYTCTAINVGDAGDQQHQEQRQWQGVPKGEQSLEGAKLHHAAGRRQPVVDVRPCRRRSICRRSPARAARPAGREPAARRTANLRRASHTPVAAKSGRARTPFARSEPRWLLLGSMRLTRSGRKSTLVVTQRSFSA